MLLEFTCSQRWRDMAGDERVRHCAQCDQQVINISDYSQAQINELQERIDCGEKICVAFKAVKPEPAEILGECLSFAFPESSAGISGLLACSLTLGSGSLLALSASPARAQDGQKQESPRKGAAVPALNKALGRGMDAKSACPVPFDSLKKQTKTTALANDVELEPHEYELMKGRPAPSALRDTITDLIYQKDDLLNILPMALRFSIKQQLENEGAINIPRVEWMAAVEEWQGKHEQALNSYRLLLALAEKQSAPPERKAELWKKIEVLAPRVYLSYLKDADKGSKSEMQILGLLLKAQEVRTLSPSIKKLCLWKELASRIDRLSGGLISPELASHALELSSSEPTQVIREWRRKYIDVLVRQFAERLGKAKREFVSGKYWESEETIKYLFLPIDPEAAAACDIDQYLAFRLKLVPNLNDDQRYSEVMYLVKIIREPTYHPKDEKYRKVLAELVATEVKKRIALSRDALIGGDRHQALWRLWGAEGLIKALPDAIPEALVKEVKTWRLEMKLKPGEEGPFS
jgi:hypothetical protein